LEHPYKTEKNLSALFFRQADRYGKDTFMWAKIKDGRPAEKWEPVSWMEAAEQVSEFAAGLIELGLQKGDRVAIFSQNRPRWIMGDQAIQAAGGVGVPIYPTSTDEQLAYILKDSQAKGLIAGNEELLAQVLRVKPDCPDLRFIVAMSRTDGDQGESLYWDEVIEKGKASSSAAGEVERRRGDISPDDPAAIIYTSGTTGEPKGAVLCQSNFMTETEMLLDAPITNKMVERGIRMTSLCHLPLCHIYGRTSDYHVQMAMAGELYFAESYQAVQRNLKEVRPQMLITIPRLYEKVYEAVLDQSNKLTGMKKKLFDWSIETGQTVVDHLASGTKLPPPLAIKFALAGTLVFNSVRKASGLDRLVFAGSGGGALSPEINRFFRAMNLQIGEGYGLTETTSAVSWNGLDFLEDPPDTWPYRLGLDWLIDTMVLMQSQGNNPYSNPIGIVKLTYAANVIVHRLIQKPGTVGRPCKYTEIRLAEDGEIEVKGPQVMKRDLGYFNRPDLTDEVFTDDGFFMTGDIGSFDEQGYLKITDRKKELLVTAGGKNVAPHPIEMRLALDPLVEQACVVGDARKYLSALIVPQYELLQEWANKNMIDFDVPTDLIEKDEIIKLYQDKVEKVNQGLARYEQIKKFRLLPTAFTEETGELTPTQKMKRRVIHEKFQDYIDSMYE